MLDMTALFPSATFQPDATVRDDSSQIDQMIWIQGGTFRMGSDKHYPEEAPAHRVTVDGFWIDLHPVTNRQFREFVRATKHAEPVDTSTSHLGFRCIRRKTIASQ